MIETPPFHTNPEQWAQDVAGQYPQGFPPNLLISDLDDTLLDSSSTWYEDYTRLAMDAGIGEDEIIDPETFSIRGPRVTLTERHGLIDPKEYPAYKHERMHSPAFHEGMQPLDDAAKTLASRNLTHIPNGYISTRPAVLGLITRQSLASAGFAPTPLLLRPEHTPYEDTVAFKITALSSLKRILPRATTVSYVDDFKGVTDAIDSLEDSGIQGIHYGSYTWQEIFGTDWSVPANGLRS